jgi:hypothetical protein
MTHILSIFLESFSTQVAELLYSPATPSILGVLSILSFFSLSGRLTLTRFEVSAYTGGLAYFTSQLQTDPAFLGQVQELLLKPVSGLGEYTYPYILLGALTLIWVLASTFVGYRRSRKGFFKVLLLAPVALYASPVLVGLSFTRFDLVGKGE